MEISRRNVVTAGGSLLAASVMPVAAIADESKSEGDTLYGHGMVWNRALPGVAAELRLSFDLRLNLSEGNGQGTAEDPVYPDWNLHFSVDSLRQEKRPKGEVRYIMAGVVTRANNPANVGLPVRIIAETVGDTTAIAIRLGDLAFDGAGLVVVAIIRTLIDILLDIRH